ncbi:MAG TPA: hypothetical protein VJ879_03310 [Desulfobacter sp.]|nr:hypothetical protein [Desulfobacter sp.]
MFQGIKDKRNKLVIKQIKKSLIKALADKDIPIDELLTPKIEQQFDALAQAIIDEHGFKKLSELGLKHFL